VGWQLRAATVDDLEPIMQLETGTFGTDAWSAEAMRSDLRSPHTWYLVAEREGATREIDGYAGLLAPRGGTDGEIQTIAVAEGARRGGLGRAMMTALIGEARKRGAVQVFLEVRQDNPPARTLYDSLGFEEIAVRPNYYQPDGVDAIVMRLRVPDPVTRPAVGA
jgi:ribosomal-protein-alanine N-acetyltransferase